MEIISLFPYVYTCRRKNKKLFLVYNKKDMVSVLISHVFSEKLYINYVTAYICRSLIHTILQ